LGSIKCKECNHEISYTPCVNFIVFCPNCLKQSYLECEYGYGPVVPCNVFLGEKEIGIINEREYTYILQTQYSDEVIELKKEYLEALQEAAEIIKRMLKA
jgi:hypothetical protein